MAASSKSTWLVEKTHSSYLEFRSIQAILFPKTSKGETLHDDFSFVCLSRYLKTEWVDDKRIPYVCIRMYLQTRQQKRKGSNNIIDTRFTLDEINGILQTEGFKEWDPPYPIGSRDRNPFLLVHAVFGCADRTYCGGELRTKGPGKSIAAEDALKAIQKGTVEPTEELDDVDEKSARSGKNEVVFVGVTYSPATRPVKTERGQRVPKREKENILRVIPAVPRETYHEPGENRKRQAAEVAIQQMKKQRQQELTEEEAERPPRTIAVKHHNVSTPEVRGSSAGKFSINRSPESKDGDILTSPTSQKYTHHDKATSPTSSDESRKRNNYSMIPDSKQIPKNNDPEPAGSDASSSDVAPTNPTSEVKENNDDEEVSLNPQQHQLTNVEGGTYSAVAAPVKTSTAMMNDFEAFLQWKDYSAVAAGVAAPVKTSTAMMEEFEIFLQWRGEREKLAQAEGDNTEGKAQGEED